MHYLAYQRVRGARVAAIATRDPKKLAGDWRETTGNFGPPGAKFNLGPIARYASYQELLADPQIDLVDVCLPPAQHAHAAIAALRAGKHVFCEKPIALSPAEADRMVSAAKHSGKQLAVAHVLPYFPEYHYALATARSGKLGRLLGGSFKRIISDPTWLVDFYNPRVVGGPLIDLHIHDAHFIRVLFGQPQGVFSRGRTRDEVVEFATTQFLFADPKLNVTATSGVIHQQGRSFTHGFEIYFEKGTLVFDFSVLGGKPHVGTPLTLLDRKGNAMQPKLSSGDPLDAFAAEIQEVLKSIKSGRPSDLLGAALARDALVLCHKQSQSVLSGRLVKV